MALTCPAIGTGRAIADRLPLQAAGTLSARRHAGRSVFLALALVLAMGRQAHATEALNARDEPIAARAFQAWDRDQPGKAEEIAETASDKLPLKILQWLDLLRPNAGHSFAEISAFIEANPDWPHQSAAADLYWPDRTPVRAAGPARVNARLQGPHPES